MIVFEVEERGLSFSFGLQANPTGEVGNQYLLSLRESSEGRAERENKFPLKIVAKHTRTKCTHSPFGRVARNERRGRATLPWGPDLKGVVSEPVAVPRWVVSFLTLACRC